MMNNMPFTVGVFYKTKDWLMKFYNFLFLTIPNENIIKRTKDCVYLSNNVKIRFIKFEPCCGQRFDRIFIQQGATLDELIYLVKPCLTSRYKKQPRIFFVDDSLKIIKSMTVSSNLKKYEKYV